MTYLRNNIVFRRSSAAHFATFYHAKSLLLGQVLDSDTHTFSSTAREILLQYFSVTTEVLMKIEIEFIKSNSIITDKLTTTCASLLCEGLANMKTVIEDNPSDFDPKLTNIWVPILDATLPRISYRLATLIHDNIYESFGTLVNYCVGYLNHILYVLHEIDYLCYNGAEPFMYLDKWDIKMKVDEKLSTNEIRLSSYMASGLLNADKKFVLKSEIDSEWLERDSQRIAAYQYAVDLFHRNNLDVEIQPRNQKL